ncbi:MAG: hypothetical protein PF508_11750 [Spirochaeta sp.]|jgi:hypothetical protein|nr:hypothetical protein [Spirochaeta sp.]
MARNNYSGEKRRRELNKKKKKERKLRERAERAPDGTEEDTSYLEYLNPGGPQDRSLVEEETDEESEDGSTESDARNDRPGE